MIGIDLGSNTLRFVAIDCVTKEILFEDSIIVKSADGIAYDGNITDGAITRIVEGIKYMDAKYDFSKHTIKAVTTEALRRAKNSKEVLGFIRKKTGICFEVISGDEEARLTLLAVRFRLARLGIDKNFMLVDIGGGSTEIIFATKDSFVSKSFPIGIVTLTQKYDTLSDIATAIDNDSEQMAKFIGANSADMFIATAGTPTTLAAMKLGMDYESYDAKRINGVVLSLEDVKMEFQRLLDMDEEMRKKSVGVGREDLITTGVLILQKLYDLSGFDACIVIDDGLREGVALEGCKG